MGVESKPTQKEAVLLQQGPIRPSVSLLKPFQENKPTSLKLLQQLFLSLFRSFSIVTPTCRLPSLPSVYPESRCTKVTGTLFGYRKGRVSLSIQEAPKCLPTLVIELAMQTSILQKEMSSGTVRIGLECDKSGKTMKMKLLEEPIWTMYCNGKKTGYGVKREAMVDDLTVMEILKPVSMGTGVLPGRDGADAVLAYMRAHFKRVVGSRDSETLYMLSPDGHSGPELSIFFVRS